MLAFDAAEREVAEHLLTTTRSVRKRLDLDRQVDLAIVRDCLRLALQAPTGSNLQQWRWIVVQDPTIRAQVAQVYRDVVRDPANAAVIAHYTEVNARAFAAADPDQMARMIDSVQRLMATMANVPVLLVPCMVGRFESDLFAAATLFGSIYPAVWSLQLALRTHGLGTVLTTAHLVCADRMAEVLGIPEGVTQAGLLPIGHITGEGMSPAKRRPVEEVAFLDRWSKPL